MASKDFNHVRIMNDFLNRPSKDYWLETITPDDIEKIIYNYLSEDI